MKGIKFWTWLDGNASSSSPSLHGCLRPGTKDDGDDIPEITHSVVFKCIGAHKEMEYQEILALANKNFNDGKRVSVKLKPELDNPYDNKAVAFICQTEENAEWKRIRR